MSHVLWSWLRGLPTYADFWNAFWAALFGAITGVVLAFQLERRRREAERKREEIGKLYTLHFFVIHMASVLGGFREQLFGKEGEPQRSWDRIRSLDGVPERGADFEIKEYAFLLDGAKPTALALLNNIYFARVNFNSTLERLHIRNRLWNELQERQVGATFARGEAAINRIGQHQAVAERISELTMWLRMDFRETIEELEAIQPLLHEVFQARYPKERFSVSAPKPLAYPGLES